MSCRICLHHHRSSITNTGAFLPNGDTPPVFTPGLTGISLPRSHHPRPCSGCNGQGRRERLAWLGRREARRGGGVECSCRSPTAGSKLRTQSHRANSKGKTVRPLEDNSSSQHRVQRELRSLQPQPKMNSKTGKRAPDPGVTKTEPTQHKPKTAKTSP